MIDKNEIQEREEIDFVNLCSKGLTEFPIDICNRPNIHWIFLDNNKISSLPKELGNLKKLFWLTLRNNNFTEFPLDILIMLINNGLRRIDLSGNPITNIPSYMLGEDPQYHGMNLTRIVDYLIQTQESRENLFILNKFIELIDNQDTSEPTITKFLATERNQFILKLYFSSPKIYDQIECIWQTQQERKNLIPDFFIETANGFSNIIDFKLPHTKNIITGTENRKRFSSKITEYISQLENYRDYFDETLNQDFVRNKYNIKVLKPTITLIIGRRKDFGNLEWKKLESRFHNLQIINYDDVIDVVKNTLAHFKLS